MNRSLCLGITYGKQVLKLDIGLTDNVAVIVVQGVDEGNEATEEISTFHAELRDAADEHCLESLRHSHIIRTTPIAFTQLLERELCNILGSLLAWNCSTLSDLNVHVLSDAIICKLIPHIVNLLRRLIIVMLTRIIVTIHTHRVQKSIVD